MTYLFHFANKELQNATEIGNLFFYYKAIEAEAKALHISRHCLELSTIAWQERPSYFSHSVTDSSQALAHSCSR